MNFILHIIWKQAIGIRFIKKYPYKTLIWLGSGHFKHVPMLKYMYAYSCDLHYKMHNMVLHVRYEFVFIF